MKTIVSIFWPWSLLAKKTGHIWKYATHAGLSNSKAKWKDVLDCIAQHNVNLQLFISTL